MMDAQAQFLLTSAVRGRTYPNVAESTWGLGETVKEFKIYLSVDDILHVRIVHDGPVVTEFCVAYELIVGGKSYQPCRIDNAHGEVHMDFFGAGGQKIRKKYLGHVDPQDMVTTARNLLETQIPHHRERILKELGVVLE